jgi:hypothetical protein
MQNFLLKAKLFVAANKTFVAVVVFGVIILFMMGGGSGIQKMTRTLSFNSLDSYEMGAVTVTGQAYGGGSNAASYSYAAKGVAVPSVAPMPPIYNTPASTAQLPSDKKIIQNGSLELLVKSADTAAQSIRAIAESNGGSVQNSNIYEYTEGVKSGSITVRVPSTNFSATMDAVKKVATKVNRENVSSDDVTAEYVDLEAQVKNYKAEEKQYQDIMSRAVKIEDVMSVASKLAEVRNRIERTQGQLNYISRQVAMSTISISLTAEPEVKVLGIVWRPLTVLKQAFRNMLQDFTGFVDWLIQFIFKVPIYLLRLAAAALILWVIWKLLVVLKRKWFAPKI